MKLKILNNSKLDIISDVLKVVDFFKTRLPFPLEFGFEITDIPVEIKPYLERQGFDPQTGKPALITYYGVSNIPKNADEIFVWNLDTVKVPEKSVITCFAEPSLFIQISINQYAKDHNDIWLKISHEILHYLCFKANQAGIPTLDEMDTAPENSNPFSLTGNYSKTLANLQPYFNSLVPFQFYKPKNFSLKELVPKTTIDKLGDKAWELLDERMLRNIQFFRDTFGVIYINTPTQQFRCFDPSEFRKEGLSQHNHGRAVDCTFKNYTSEQVREWLRQPENVSRLPEPNIWVEIGTPHLHFDVRYSDKKGIYFFNP